MKHDSFPYNETEWNKIVDDAFAPDAQPHVFSERYTSRKQEFRRQMEESHMKQHKFRMKKSLTAAVAVAAAIVVIPTAVYASTQIRGYFQNGGGEYQQEMVIPKSDSVSDQIMALQVGWMPDGMATDPNSGKYRDPNGRSITMLFYKMDNTDDALTHTVNYSVSQETLTCGSNTVLYAVTDTTGVSGKDVFEKLSAWRRELLRIKRYYEQLTLIFDEASANDNSVFSNSAAKRFAILKNRTDRYLQTVQNLRDVIEHLQEEYQAQLSIQQNDLMKLFTVVTVIFLPLTLLTGWYGMNFSGMPELNWEYGYLVIIVVSIVVLVALILFFRRKKWL